MLSAQIERVRRGAASSPLELAALVALVLGGLVLVVRAATQSWTPTGDDALIELLVRDVPAHMPLTGVYSRLGWSHPGPAQFVLLAPIYRLLGSRSAGLLAGTVVVHLCALGAAWALLRRIDRVVGIAVLVALQAMLVVAAPEYVQEPWNPYVALVLTATLVAAAWSTAERRVAGAVLVLPVASVLVQAHIGNLAVAAVTAAVGLGLATLPLGRDRPLPWRGLAWGAGIAAVLWLPVAIGEVTDGNLRTFARYVLDGSDGQPTAGAGLAGRVISHSYAVHPDWLGGGGPSGYFYSPAWAVPALLVVPLVGLACAAHRRDAPFLRGFAIAGAAQVGVFAGAAAIRGEFYEYLVIARLPVAAFLVALGAASIVRSLPWPSAAGVAVALCGAASVVATGVLCLVQWNVELPYQGLAPTISALADGAEHDTSGRPVELTYQPDFATSEVHGGLVLELERRGVDVSVPAVADGQDMANRFGSHRITAGADVDRLVLVPPERVAGMESGGAQVVAAYRPLSRSAERRMLELLAERAEVADATPGTRAAELSAAHRIRELVDIDRQLDRIREDGTPMYLMRPAA